VKIVKNKKKVIFKRLAATHGVSSNIRDCLKDGYIKYIKEEKTSGISLANANFGGDFSQCNTHSHWGMNIPFGGHGLTTFFGDKISGNGENGHLYIYHLPAEEKKCGAILLGLEGSEYGKYDTTGHRHNINATSSIIGVALGFKWASEKKNTKSLPTEIIGKQYPKKTDGMFVDLSFGFEFIEKMYLRWNDDWVMEPPVKPHKINKKEFLSQTIEVSPEEKLEIIKFLNIPSKEKIKLYHLFIEELLTKKDYYQILIEKENKNIDIARERINFLSVNSETATREELLNNLINYKNELEKIKIEYEEMKKKECKN